MPKLHALKLPLILAVAVLAAALVTALALGTSSREPSPQTPLIDASRAGDGHGHAGDPAHQKPTLLRTLAVYTDAEPAPSAHPARMRALLTKGKLPGGVVQATVLTDENCAPDKQGVSHCRNELKLPDGRTVTVRHPHRMADVPCMTRGETVRLGRAADA
jgi:hypothetical protein